MHIEPGAVEALRAAYARLLPAGGSVLDLMSSWRSHLPGGTARVTGLGMNAAEMADNPQLDGFVVHDLNRLPRLPFAEGAFDAAVCAVSIQYLVHPVAVLTDLRRVVRPGGPVVMSFSNRCFPTKAVLIWRMGEDQDHVALVRAYFESAGYRDIHDEAPPTPDDPLFIVRATAEPSGAA